MTCNYSPIAYKAQCSDGYNYSYGDCCNVSMYRFWNAMIWVSLFCCLFALCSMMGARARRRRMLMMQQQ